MMDWETKLKQDLLSLKSTITVPDCLEETLRTATTQVRPRRRYKPSRLIALVASVFLLLNIFYYSPALAYQVQRILGYDTVMNKTLSSLNNEGLGQIINQTYTDPETGISLSLDGVILDKTQLIVFYTIKGTPKYLSQNLDFSLFNSLTYKQFGLWGRTASPRNGHGEFNAITNEMKWQMAYEPPSKFTNTLNFSFQMDYRDAKDPNKSWHQPQMQTLSFTLDRSKALASMIKQSLNIPLQIGDAKLTLLDIEAAPTQTIIHLAGQDAGGLDKARGFIGSNTNDLQLLVNGKPLSRQGGGSGSGQGKLQYSSNYDAIKEKVKTLQLLVKQMNATDNTQISTTLTTGRKMILDTKSGQPLSLNVLEARQTGDNVEVILHMADEPLASVADATISGPLSAVNLTDTREENLSKVAPPVATPDAGARMEYDQVLVFKGARLMDLTTLTITKAKLVHRPNLIVDIPVH